METNLLKINKIPIAVWHNSVLAEISVSIAEDFISDMKLYKHNFDLGFCYLRLVSRIYYVKNINTKYPARRLSFYKYKLNQWYIVIRSIQISLFDAS